MITLSDLGNKEQILQAIFDILPNVYWKDKKSGKYIGANDNQAKTLNLASVDDFIGKTSSEIALTPKEAEAIEKNDNAIMDSGKPAYFEETISTPTGVKKMLSHKHPIFNDTGEVIGLLGYSIEL